jgi:hypothetical protein
MQIFRSSILVQHINNSMTAIQILCSDFVRFRAVDDKYLLFGVGRVSDIVWRKIISNPKLEKIDSKRIKRKFFRLYHTKATYTKFALC